MNRVLDSTLDSVLDFRLHFLLDFQERKSKPKVDCWRVSSALRGVSAGLSTGLSSGLYGWLTASPTDPDRLSDYLDD